MSIFSEPKFSSYLCVDSKQELQIPRAHRPLGSSVLSGGGLEKDSLLDQQQFKIIKGNDATIRLGGLYCLKTVKMVERKKSESA